MIPYTGLRGERWYTAATVVTCVVVVLNNAVYFDGGPTPRFLLEKAPWSNQPLWLAAFYFHVVGASVCLLVGLPLMFPGFTRRYPAWHKRLGYVYFNAVLWMAAPAGLILAPVAKGGLWGAAGFLLAGLLWWHVTWRGYRAILRRDVAQHVQYMVRSYALALSAPAFRVFQALLYVGGMNDDLNYVVSLWLSLAASVCLAEFFSLRRAGGGFQVAPVRPTFLPGEFS